MILINVHKVVTQFTSNSSHFSLLLLATAAAAQSSKVGDTIHVEFKLLVTDAAAARHRYCCSNFKSW
jgi:hypothetical protein